MMQNFPERIICFDTEYTAWAGSKERDWGEEGEFREVVQIGAVKLKNLDEVDSFSRLIQPVKNPNLSEYFSHLTGITQEMLAGAIDLDLALHEFYTWSESLDLYSYGLDGVVLKENAELLRLSFPFSDSRFLDIRGIFRNIGIATDKYSSGTILHALGKKPLPHAHDAVNDARSISLALKILIERNAILGQLES
ncbi:MAG: 3'-5' exonuclease [Candidatus Paceibacterota bacterium]